MGGSCVYSIGTMMSLTKYSCVGTSNKDHFKWHSKHGTYYITSYTFTCHKKLHVIQ